MVPVITGPGGNSGGLTLVCPCRNAVGKTGMVAATSIGPGGGGEINTWGMTAPLDCSVAVSVSGVSSGNVSAIAYLLMRSPSSLSSATTFLPSSCMRIRSGAACLHGYCRKKATWAPASQTPQVLPAPPTYVGAGVAAPTSAATLLSGAACSRRQGGFTSWCIDACNVGGRKAVRFMAASIRCHIQYIYQSMWATPLARVQGLPVHCPLGFFPIAARLLSACFGAQSLQRQIARCLRHTAAQSALHLDACLADHAYACSMGACVIRLSYSIIRLYSTFHRPHRVLPTFLLTPLPTRRRDYRLARLAGTVWALLLYATYVS